MADDLGKYLEGLGIDQGDGDDHEYRITRVALDVRGVVPGLDEDAFAEVARHADEQCPISAALRGNVEVELTTVLQTA